MRQLQKSFLAVFIFSFLELFMVCAAQAADPLIKRPVFACGSGADFKQADAGAFNTNTSRFDYTFDRSSETIFESGQVKPIALSLDDPTTTAVNEAGKLLFVSNTPANCLEIYDTSNDKLQLVSSVSVGVEPVSLATRNNSAGDVEVWVVNHISDSVSIVSWNNGASPKAPLVRNTLLVGDEPRDIVFGDSGNAGSCSATNQRNTAFVTTAYRGQHHPTFNPDDLLKESIGRASVFVFDANSPNTQNVVIPLYAMPARALAVTPNGCSVYAATFLSGNQTTLAIASNGPANSNDIVDSIKRMLFGTNQEKTQDGITAPTNNVIVKFIGGKWLDGVTGADFSDRVGLRLADNDVFTIDAREVWVTGNGLSSTTFKGVGTTLFNMVVNPAMSNKIYVSNIESRNEKRYVGNAVDSLPTVRGHFVEHRITEIDTSAPSVTVHHLNDHMSEVGATTFLNYDDRPIGKSMTQPTDMVVSSDGTTLYVANFGSKSVTKIPLTGGALPSTINTSGTSANSNIISMEAKAGADPANPGVNGGGPAGLALSLDNGKLFVYTRFDNAITVVDTSNFAKVVRTVMQSPESTIVKQGRPFLYDATMSSKNGTGSCGGCHIYGDMDMLAWDLGKPTGDMAFNALHLSIANAPSQGNRVINGFIPLNTGTITNLGQLGTATSPLTMKNIDTAGPLINNYYNEANAAAAFATTNQTFSNEAVVVDRTESDNSFLDGLLQHRIFIRTDASFLASAQLWPKKSVYVCQDSSTGNLKFSFDGVTPLDPDNAGATCTKTGQQYYIKWVDPSGSCKLGFNTCTGFVFAQGHGATATVRDNTYWIPSATVTETQQLDQDMVAGHADLGQTLPEVFLTVGVDDLASPHPCIGDCIMMTVFNGGTILPGTVDGVGDMRSVGAGTFFPRTGPNNFHPLKGPMTTQTLRGIADSGAMHWRGDKSGGDGVGGGGHCPPASGQPTGGIENCVGDASNPQELRSFKQFNEAFIGLLGKDSITWNIDCNGESTPLLPAGYNPSVPDPDRGLCDSKMDKFAEFVMRLTLPPNPIVNLNNSLPNNTTPSTRAADGQNMFNLASGTPGASSLFKFPGQSFGANCVACHALDRSSNLFGTDKSVTFETAQQFIKVPHLRNAYQKVGMFYLQQDMLDENEDLPRVFKNPANRLTNTPQVAGFGYGHDGQFGTLVDFFDFQFSEVLPNGTAPDGATLTREHARNLAMYMMAFETNVMPTVGQQVTLRAADFPASWSGKDSDILDQTKVTQMHVLFSQAIADDCDLIKTDIVGGASHTYKFKGAESTCTAANSHNSGNDEMVCFTTDNSDPSPNNGVPVEFTDGVTKGAIADGSVEEATFSCLPKGNNAMRNNYAAANSTRIIPDLGDQVIMSFSPAITASSFFLTNSAATYPRHIQVFGSNTSGVIVAGDELLADTILPPVNTSSTSPDIQIKRGNSAYQFYKIQIIDTQDTSGNITGTCSGSCSASIATGTATHWTQLDTGTITPSADSDGDGVPDNLDAFPVNNAASVDTDGDGQPDSWNTSCNASCQTGSGLTQDNDNDNDGLTNEQEMALETSSTNPFDPPLAAASDYWLVGVDRVSPSPYLPIGQLWSASNGAWYMDGSLEASTNDVALTNSGGLCTLDKFGSHCLFYPFDPAMTIKKGIKQKLYHSLSEPDYLCVMSSDTSVGVKCARLDGSAGTLIRTIPTLTNPTDITIGTNNGGFSCALHNAGATITCWDIDTLGTVNTIFGTSTPALLTNTIAVAIAAGENHLCAITESTLNSAIRTIKCWGNNDYDQQSWASVSPVRPLRIDAGLYHTCIVDSFDGNAANDFLVQNNTQVKCWGAGTAQRSLANASVPNTQDVYQSVVPTSVNVTNANPVSIRAGGHQTCAVLAKTSASQHQVENNVVCWPVNISVDHTTIPDSDGDGLTDADEIIIYHTNPQSTDTDGDGVCDGDGAACTGLAGKSDKFPLIAITGFTDIDTDGAPDACPCGMMTLDIDGYTIIGTAGSDTIAPSSSGTFAFFTVKGLADTDSITTLDGTDFIYGGDGNDTMTGGLGDDTMYGGLGDDTYIVNVATDVVNENVSGGTDVVQSPVTYSIASYPDVENLTLTGIATSVNGTGNVNENVIDGSTNTAVNTLTGDAGDDTYIVGSGDIVVETNGITNGIDVVFSAVTYTIASYPDVENLTLTGTATGVNGTGNVNENVIDGSTNTAVNTLTGGSGDDTYIVGSGDIVVETNGITNGIDTVFSAVTYTITDGDVENLTLTGMADINATGNGNANVITGNNGDNTISCLAGTDTVSFAPATAGITFDLSLTTPQFTGGAGTDTLASTACEYLTGSAYNDTLTGNNSANVINGGIGSDILNGGSGNDTLNGGNNNDILVGGAGTDSLTGDSGNDKFTFNALADMGGSVGAADNITDLISGDQVDLSPITDVDTSTSGNQGSFSFLGTGNSWTMPFTAAGQLRFNDTVSPAQLELNTNSNLTSIDYYIKLTNVTSFASGDLIP